ncbi:hypothetical protein SPF06_03025 [Sinomonas sp. JGH33]|uniref:Lipoprotein n=1 Tax=Sinomonas terricola TaxID=3110330 RepID=A0ABU5T217_9MICC|nr:hypothetical protein [Sinomonas sp. JGH33]MEA5453685.1 hypothetical protein [Sinomonas sp. JGH33]
MCALLAIAALAGCAANKPEFTPPRKLAGSFEELVDQTLALPGINDFEREVYRRAKETGRIAQADYDEAYSMLSACLSEGGEPIMLRRLKNGIYRIQTTPLSPGESLEQAMDVVSACQRTTTGYIPELFKIQQINPELIGDSIEAEYRCLEQSGLIREEYSLEEFRKSQHEPPPPGKRSTDDMPFDFYSDEAQSCLLGMM